MNMPAMTQVEKPNLHTLFDTLKLSPVWPEPELCCGVLYCQYGKDKCWEAIHDVQKLYNERLRQEIEDLVDDVQDELQRSSNTSPFFGHSIYMVGRKKKRANPFVFFHCRLEAPRSKAASILKGSKIMKEYPAIRVSHVPVPPESHVVPRYATGAVGLKVSFADQRSVFARRLPDGLCGVKVIVDNGRPVPEWVHATIGGCILLRGKFYGLTAGHGLQHSAITEPEEIECEGDLCTYPGYNADEGEDEELSSDSDNSEEIKDLTWKGKQTLSYSSDGLGTTDIVSPFDLSFGILKYTSIENGSLGLDWALVELSAQVLQLDLAINEMPDYRTPRHAYRQSFPLKGIVQSLPYSSNSNYKHSVIAVTGRSGKIAGWISGTSSSMQLPGAARLQELWSVRLEAPIEQGDCGSFVVDPLNGNVFGHIVAGNLERGLVYIVPAWKTQSDIARQLGSMFTFPDNNTWKSISAPSELQSDEDFNVPLPMERISPPGEELAGLDLNRQPRVPYSSKFSGGAFSLSYESSNTRSTNPDDSSESHGSKDISRDPSLDAGIGAFHYRRERSSDGSQTVGKRRATRWASRFSARQLSKSSSHPETEVETTLDDSEAVTHYPPPLLPPPSLRSKQGKDGDSATTNFNPPYPGPARAVRTALPQFQARDDTAIESFKSRYPELPDEVKNALPQLQGASWPSPELSIGNPMKSIGSYCCWKAIGPAEQILTALVTAIEVLFSERSEELNFTPVMIGRTAETASPAIVIQSEDRGLRQRTTARLRESRIMDPFPASIKLMEISWRLNSSELSEEKAV